MFSRGLHFKTFYPYRKSNNQNLQFVLKIFKKGDQMIFASSYFSNIRMFINCTAINIQKYCFESCIPNYSRTSLQNVFLNDHIWHKALHF